MKIVLGSDHAGMELKNSILKYLESLGYEAIDCGTYSLDSCDYPDYAKKVASMVAKKEANYGVLVCYTGIGMSITANKFKGIRAALVSNSDAARLTREHNDANIICLSSKDLNIEQAKSFVDIFLNTPFSNGERHLRRINKIKEIEENNG